MSGVAYKNFMKVLEKWPVDPLKKGKDVGEGLRLLFSKEFPSGPNSILTDEKHVNRQIYASRLLCEDHFVKKYPRVYDSTFTDLQVEDLKQITSTELMSELSEASEEKPTFFQKLKNSFTKQ